MNKHYKYTITKKRFLEWLMTADNDDYIYWGKYFVDLFVANHKIKDTPKSLFLERESLPGHLFEDQMSEEDKEMGLWDTDIEISEIKLTK